MPVRLCDRGANRRGPAMAFRARHLLGIEHLAPLEITTVLDL
ncbi:MAG TPA: aspartate carbamoyltransferase catalytic subunit, partial [Tabrizicola sp.]|nr:aspartate carbamoyltransferase catalytic subunit [Tabrizicola sp.]